MLLHAFCLLPQKILEDTTGLTISQNLFACPFLAPGLRLMCGPSLQACVLPQERHSDLRIQTDLALQSKRAASVQWHCQFLAWPGVRPVPCTHSAGTPEL
jgi:hypothetical protein